MWRNKGKVCAIDGCERPAYCKGRCQAHYYRKNKRKPLEVPVTRQGESSHPLYHTWRGMIQRCHNPRNPRYPEWGGRGIFVCDRWRQSFLWFLQDMGERPDGHSLDRINNDGPYAPENCRWVTAKDQARNRRTTRVSTEQASAILEMARQDWQPKAIADAVGVRYDDVIRTVQPHLTPRPAPAKKPVWTGEPQIRRGRPARSCSADGCTEKHYAHGYCRKHWSRRVAHPGLEERLASRTCPVCNAPIPETAPTAQRFCTTTHRLVWHRQQGCYTPEAITASRGTCGLDGCEKPVHSQGLCRSHYMRLWRWGDPERTKEAAPPKGCSEPGCEGKHAARGLCFKHYHMRRNRGEFGGPLRPKMAASAKEIAT